jgi:hypothetical protein
VQAILVKYYPATNYKGAYYQASGSTTKMRFTYGKVYNLTNPARHCAETFAASLGWKGELLQGTLPNGDEVFVFDDPLSRR